jgi:hypothetical protein
MTPLKTAAAAFALLAAAAVSAESMSLAADAASGFSFPRELSGVGLSWINAGLCLAPILAWNLALSPKLRMDSFSGPLPGWYDAGENVLRGAAMIYPCLRPLDPHASLFGPGVWTYAAGTLVYFASWLPLMAEDPADWMKSLPVQLAPAYTPMLWFAGIALMAGSPLELLLAGLFVGAHFGEYLIRWKPGTAGD